VHTEAELRRVLAEVARQGWAEVDQELEAGLYSLAAPIRDANQQVVAAINVSTTSPERPAELRGQVLAAAAAISTDLERVSMVQLTR
jgi:IclR family pca regulon transcriptional regulator